MNQTKNYQPNNQRKSLLIMPNLKKFSKNQEINGNLKENQKGVLKKERNFGRDLKNIPKNSVGFEVLTGNEREKHVKEKINRSTLSLSSNNSSTDISSSSSGIGGLSGINVFAKKQALRSSISLHNNERQSSVNEKSRQTVFSNLNKKGNSYFLSESEKLKKEKKQDELTIVSKRPTMDNVFINDLNYVYEYSNDIFQYVISTENQNKPIYNYLLKHNDINEVLRLKLIDWLIDVHQYFDLRPETLYLCVNILDRYLSHEEITSSRLQLIGISSMFIASKYEEIYPPDLKDFTFVTREKFTKSEILKAEGEILRKLDFNLLHISPLLVFNRLIFISSNGKEDYLSVHMSQIRNLSNFFMELCLLEYRMLKYPSSIIAASSLFFSRKIMGIKPYWPKEEIKKQVDINTDSLLECAKDIYFIFKKEMMSKLKTLKNKYSKESNGKIYLILVKLTGNSSSASGGNGDVI